MRVVVKCCLTPLSPLLLVSRCRIASARRMQLYGQARRRSSRHAERPFHASFVWCVSSCFSCGLYNILIWAGQFACQQHSVVCWYAIVCLEREESMWMKGWSRSVVVVCLARDDLYLPSVFWCPLVGAETDSCGRDGRWKGLIF